MSIPIDDVLTLATAKNQIVRPSAIDDEHCVVDCGPCTDPNERGRMTDTGFYAVVDGRYVTVGTIDEVYKWLEGLE